MLSEFLDSSWPLLLIVLAVVATPSYVIGRIHGYGRATRDQYGPDTLRKSAEQLAKDSRDGGS